MVDNDWMQEWQKRVVAEKDALDEKLLKLRNFIKGDVFKYGDVEMMERSRLMKQARIMQMYSDVLTERIMNFK